MKFKIVYADELYKVQKGDECTAYRYKNKERNNDRSHWKGALSMPMDITDSYESELDVSQSVIFYCTHGGSSMKLARYLGNRGFDTATVIGGYNAMCGYQKKLQKYG